jgi:hypothetical protein
VLRMRPPPSSERSVVSFASGYRLCESCYEAAGNLHTHALVIGDDPFFTADAVESSKSDKTVA